MFTFTKVLKELKVQNQLYNRDACFIYIKENEALREIISFVSDLEILLEPLSLACFLIPDYIF